MDELVHGELSREINGAAMQVLNVLRPGLSETVYEKALLVELVRRGHAIDCQRAFPVSYGGVTVGTLIPDLIVDNRVIVEIKVANAFEDAHVAQISGYLAITGLSLGLLLNFKSHRLLWKRIAHTRPPPSTSA